MLACNVVLVSGGYATPSNIRESRKFFSLLMPHPLYLDFSYAKTTITDYIYLQHYFVPFMLLLVCVLLLYRRLS